MTPDEITMLNWLVRRIDSWTSARWDQHLRFEFGDERAQSLINFLVNDCGVTDPRL